MINVIKFLFIIFQAIISIMLLHNMLALEYDKKYVKLVKITGISLILSVLALIFYCFTF